MTWARAPVAAALVNMLTAATEGAVTVHRSPPELVNAPAIVVSRPITVAFSTMGFSVDEATLPLVLVQGIEQEQALDDLAGVVRSTILADPSLQATVARASPTELRNWRNLTGAGGVQLLLVELILQVVM